jgi:class 3 adenylate cyclase
MAKLIENLLGKKVNQTRVFPVTIKIILIFTLIILVSNLTSNYINLMFNRTELISMMHQLLGKDLRDIYNFCNTQHEIYQFNHDMHKSVDSMREKGLHELKNSKAIVLGIKPDGKLLFQSSKIREHKEFGDLGSLREMIRKKDSNVSEGFTNIRFNNEDYFAIYKYNQKWDIFLLRGEEVNEFYARSRMIFGYISGIVIIVTLISAVVGIFFVSFVLRYIGIITNSIMHMVQSQQLEIIPLDKAPNDDITYLGVAFNSLSSTINNLVTIFRKFANKDVAQKAYRERQIKLEGTQRELTVLFSDIKSFTFITETLGTDIIKLLNLHYDKAIREIVRYDGVIGSIIGDALLAVFGVLEEEGENKSIQAVKAAYQIQEVAESLRQKMHKRREEIVRREGKLTHEEESVFKAVLLEVGVGIDGGEVFYGTIGSYVRMTNTVIGDNVNAASRLEGLTRIYKVPVICSEFVKNDIEKSVQGHGLRFIELDTVMVKGKTIGKKVYWPVLESEIDKKLHAELENFSSGLELYYNGDWKKAYRFFSKCTLPAAEVFKDRTKNNDCPKRWNGIWEMTTK